MREFIFISKKTMKQTYAWVLVALAIGFISFVSFSQFTPIASAAEGDKTQQSQEEDYSQTPYTEYGEFNQEEEEDSDTRFFQYGRFFGVGLGLGMEGPTGTRAQLWRGGFPLFDFKLIYWFDFHLAMTLGFTNVSHNYDADIGGTTGTFNVTVNQIGGDLRYYFDTKNLSAPISFANPFILLGLGAYTKKETEPGGATATSTLSDTGLGFRIGMGVEFPLKPKKAYLTFEGKFHIVGYEDNSTGGNASAQFSSLSGLFYTLTGGFLFTW